MSREGLQAVKASEGIDLSSWRQHAIDFETELGKVVIGQQRNIHLLTIAIFARGHVLLEGDVGVGKTTLLRAASRGLGGAYERVEGTIDLMPADMVYHTYIGEDGRPRVEPGPVIRYGSELTVFFFNEINRARPQVHSLLLRLMAERSIAAFNREYHFPYLLVFADRNRIEREETFELPAAARDRFLMEINISTPTDPDVRRQLAFDPRFHDGDKLIESVRESILDHRALPQVAAAIQESVTASEDLQRYTLDLWQAIRNPAAAGIEIPDVDMDRLVSGGASPRGMSYLLRAARVAAFLDNRTMVVPEDLRAVFFETMAHRIFFDPIYELRREPIVRELVRQLFERVPAP
ncbi:AAA family ATPase [Hyphomicrobium sulfonivorans]|uniref:Methanol dehydrogenase regulatory protein MoxR n=1 Tax=Hyphomicrobium sulfonivorans TaxID=121290 RepID=A0A109BBN0_HYPSL|nr:MoxR family ATPase [Hyphomicrobium sulfonivorans]KWT65222.1 Methanol dehydrogenase regulatory protein MoxR [Hyphomicrobium sulfonivorans]